MKSPKQYRHARARCSALRTLRSAAFAFLALMIPKLIEFALRDSYTILEFKQLRAAAVVAGLMVVGNYVQRFQQIKKRQERRDERRQTNEQEAASYDQ
jgi:hypothetical protein